MRIYLIPERKPSQDKDERKGVCDALLGTRISPWQFFGCIKAFWQVLHRAQHQMYDVCGMPIWMPRLQVATEDDHSGSVASTAEVS